LSLSGFCAWKVLNLYLTQAVPYDDSKAGAAVAVQSFGDFQNFNSHLHVICTDGCFYGPASAGDQFKRLGAVHFDPNCTATPRPVASIEALFDDVMVNESAAPRAVR
jgi:hypothetical protein